MLKTVQQHLRELDRERLIDAYLYRVRHDILDYYRDGESKGHYKTIRQKREDSREFYGAYLDRLRRLKITPPTNGKHGLLYAYKRISDLSECKPEACFPYVKLEDLIEQGEDATNYAYDFDPQSEIMGYLVSDDEYTQQNIYELMVDVMYEASWFGFADEDKENFVDDLADQINQLEEGTLETCPVDDIFPDWYKEMKAQEEQQKVEEAAERSEVQNDDDEELDA
ncbi:MAG: hypothetical protein IJU71_04275, partial [Selenomonadaceae bacterium]|nr:hypothetical protein [Selenomonadaceae bacterium]